MQQHARTCERQLTGVVGTSAFSAARPIVPVSPALSHSTPSKSKAYMYACVPRDWLCAVALPCVLSDMMASGAAERMSGWIFSWVLCTHGDNGDVLRCVEPCTSSLDSYTCEPVVTCERGVLTAADLLWCTSSCRRVPTVRGNGQSKFVRIHFFTVPGNQSQLFGGNTQRKKKLVESGPVSRWPPFAAYRLIFTSGVDPSPTALR